MDERTGNKCQHCGQEFEQEKSKGGQRRRYCNDACRVAYWP